MQLNSSFIYAFRINHFMLRLKQCQAQSSWIFLCNYLNSSRFINFVCQSRWEKQLSPIMCICVFGLVCLAFIVSHFIVSSRNNCEIFVLGIFFILCTDRQKSVRLGNCKMFVLVHVSEFIDRPAEAQKRTVLFFFRCCVCLFVRDVDAFFSF